MPDLEKLYLDDFDAWCEAQIAALERHAGTLPPEIDAPRLAEELTLMLRRERRAAEAQVTRVIEHLLKLQFATEHEPRGRVWWRAVLGARSALDVFATPTLRPALAEALPEIYERAREHALLELHDRHQITLGESLPLACPYTLDQILGDWWPEWSDAG